MNSIKIPLILFAVVLLLLVGGAILLGNPEGTVENPTFSVSEEILNELGINKDELDSCTESEEFQGKVARDLAQGRELGVTGTPAILLLNKETNLGVLARGAYPFEPLNETIKVLLEDDLTEEDTAYENQGLGITLEVDSFEGFGLVDDDHIRGNPAAKILMIEFSDLDCQYCAAFHGVGIQLVNENLENLAWIYRHFPLTSIHPTAMKKALSTECAGKLAGDDGFWAFVDSYFVNLISQQ